jgi:hypothetical protein
MDIMENIDYLTIEFEDYTNINISKNIQVIISKNDQFLLNQYKYVQDICIIGSYKNENFTKNIFDIHPRYTDDAQKNIDSYNENGLFYRSTIRVNNIITYPEDKIVSFEDESEKLLNILEKCSIRIPTVNNLIFNGLFVAYAHGTKPRWYSSEFLKKYGFIGIDNKKELDNIQIYFQDKTVPKI